MNEKERERDTHYIYMYWTELMVFLWMVAVPDIDGTVALRNICRGHWQWGNNWQGARSGSKNRIPQEVRWLVLNNAKHTPIMIPYDLPRSSALNIH